MIIKALSQAELLDDETTVAGAVLVSVFSPHLEGVEVTVTNPADGDAVVGSMWVEQGIITVIEKFPTYEVAASAVRSALGQEVYRRTPRGAALRTAERASARSDGGET